MVEHLQQDVLSSLGTWLVLPPHRQVNSAMSQSIGTRCDHVEPSQVDRLTLEQPRELQTQVLLVRLGRKFHLVLCVQKHQKMRTACWVLHRIWIPWKSRLVILFLIWPSSARPPRLPLWCVASGRDPSVVQSVFHELAGPQNQWSIAHQEQEIFVTRHREMKDWTALSRHHASISQRCLHHALVGPIQLL